MDLVSVDVTANNDSSATPLSVEQRRKLERRRWWYTTILVPALFLVLMFGVPAIALILHQRYINPPIPKPTPDPEPTDTKSLISRELQLAAFDIEVAQAKQGLRHLESAQSDWSKLLATTLHDAVGKRIAGNEPLLLRFVALRRIPSPLPTEWTAAEFAKQLDDLHEHAKSHIGAHSLDRLMVTTEEVKQKAFVLYAFHQARVNQLHALRESAATLPASNVELSAAISMRATSLANDVNAATEEVTRETEASLASELKQLTKERDDAAGSVAALKMQLSRVEKGESLAPQTTGDVPAPLASRQDYEKELEQIRTDLIAFTTPGYVQPETADKLVYRKTKRPVSYSALQRIGALEETEKGRAILLRVGGSKSATQQNDRPLGRFPRMNSISELRKPAVAARVEEAQRLLRLYGPLMVEDGLLAP